MHLERGGVVHPVKTCHTYHACKIWLLYVAVCMAVL